MEKEEIQNEEFNSEPIYYCTHCLSLAIKEVDGTTLECCDRCGSSDIGIAHIDEWNSMYVERYGHTFLEEDNKY